jgi:hypothetical protein
MLPEPVLVTKNDIEGPASGRASLALASADASLTLPLELELEPPLELDELDDEPPPLEEDALRLSAGGSSLQANATQVSEKSPRRMRGRVIMPRETQELGRRARSENLRRGSPDEVCSLRATPHATSRGCGP